ncbi:hypothetical protein PROFUN_09569 [Planoprotostelium fungivorum]|uniref:Uncharacterized protein n=1 Tax=Planoprotostelium fungivorum TaxID=1890364 RepID=A0A2P6NGS3_9EUKA|nr:hypothetical protein PROFUN_09569 [Planoprotostelium fungivorum]
MDDDVLTQFIHAKKNPGQSPVLFSDDRQQIIKQLCSYRLKPIEAAESAVLGPNREILQRRVLIERHMAYTLVQSIFLSRHLHQSKGHLMPLTLESNQSVVFHNLKDTLSRVIAINIPSVIIITSLSFLCLAHLLRLCRHVLLLLKEATLLFSQKKAPLLPNTLSCFHILQDHCDRMEEEELPVIAAAAQRMSATIRKYYKLTDDCKMYHMATQILRSTFTTHYKVQNEEIPGDLEDKDKPHNNSFRASESVVGFQILLISFIYSIQNHLLPLQ